MNREKLLIAGALATVLAVVFLVAGARWADDSQGGPALAALPGLSPPPGPAAPAAPGMTGQIRGIWLQVHNDDPRCPFEDYVREIATSGANTIGLAVAAEQENGSSTVLYLDRKKTPSDERLVGLIRLSRSLGKQVVLMPIVLLSRPGADEWRGKINPDDWDAWWRMYNEYILHYAQIAQENGVTLFMVGSELISTERQEARWRDLIAQVRKQNQDLLDGQFRQHLREKHPQWRARDFQARLGVADIETFCYSAGRPERPPEALIELYEQFLAPRRMLLSYSANWDHYTVPKWWDDLDAVGMTSYYDLNPLRDAEPSVENMVRQWEPIRQTVAEWQAKIARPIIFTEVGWPSQDGCSSFPWNYFHKPDSPDMAEQQACMDSFLKVFGHQPWVSGVLIWKWRDHPQCLGGPNDSGYTPYGKPVMQTLQAYFASPAPAASSPASAPAAEASEPPAATPAAMMLDANETG